jgi:hypothetical protein
LTAGPGSQLGTDDPDTGQEPGGEGASGSQSGQASGEGTAGEGGTQQAAARSSAAERKAREEAAATRRKLREAEDELKKLRESQLTVDERREAERSKALKQAEDAQRRAQEAELKLQVALKANKLNLVDPEAAVSLLPRNQLEYDDTGAVLNLDELLEELLEARPWLKTQAPPPPRPPATGSTSPPANPAQRGPELTIAQVRKMSREEIMKRQDEVDEALARGR